MAGENSHDAPAPSLRDIAEQAYDDLETGAETEAPRPLKGKPLPKSLLHPRKDRAIKAVAGSPSRRPSRVKQSENPPIQPRRNQNSEPRATEPDPAAQARSNQVPEHWSAEDKATFSKLPQEGQAFLLKRHGEMEAEFTRKAQASAGAVQFTQSLAPVFTDRRIQTRCSNRDSIRRKPSRNGLVFTFGRRLRTNKTGSICWWT